MITLKAGKRRLLAGIALLACVEMAMVLANTSYYLTFFSNDLVFDVNNASSGHEVLGFGANVWNGDGRIHGLVHDLNFKFVRMFYGGADCPANVSGWMRADFDALYAGLAQSATIDMLRAHNVSVIVTPGIPGNWLDAGSTFKPEYIQSIAILDGALAGAMSGLGQPPEYMESFNEPDGSWNGHVLPTDYNAIVKALRAELDFRGLQSVKIDGPGLAHVDLGDRDEYVESLDAQGLDAIGAWSLHGWEWTSEVRADPALLRQAFANGFIKSIRARDPGRTRPVLVTEYSTFAFNNDQGIPDSESIPFAIRVFENTLSFLNGGANGLVYWQGADQAWDPNNTWSFLRLNGTGRPVYHAATTLYPKIPTGARVVPVDDQAYGAYTGVFATNTTVVMMLVNRFETSQTITVHAKGIAGALLAEAIGFENGQVVNKSLSMDLERITMPPLSSLTLTFTR
nr:hypothetical protein [Candidatus Sigynarchaeota archaeon]